MGEVDRSRQVASGWDRWCAGSADLIVGRLDDYTPQWSVEGGECLKDGLSVSHRGQGTARQVSSLRHEQPRLKYCPDAGGCSGIAVACSAARGRGLDLLATAVRSAVRGSPFEEGLHVRLRGVERHPAQPQAIVRPIGAVGNC